LRSQPRHDCEFKDLEQHLLVCSWVLDHAPLPDLAPPRLELRLDQRDDLAARDQPARHRRQDEAQRDERHIDRRQPNRLGEFAQGSGVLAFHEHHPRIVPQPPVQLPVADIDRINPVGAVLQQAVGESAGRGPDVGAHPSGRLQPELLEGRLQLLTTPGDEAGGGDHFDCRVRGHPGRGLQHELSLQPHLAGHDHPLGEGAALDQAARDEQLIEPFLRFRHLFDRA